MPGGVREKDGHIRLVFAPEEYTELQRRAREKGLTPTAYVRMTVLERLAEKDFWERQGKGGNDVAMVRDAAD